MKWVIFDFTLNYDDISKAFDIALHNKLVYKLSHYGARAVESIFWYKEFQLFVKIIKISLKMQGK